MMKILELGRALVIAGLLVPSPIVWAQALEVADVETTRTAVETQVERLVTEVAAKDPELAKEIAHQKELCVRDLSDGRLESPEFTKEIETYRDVQRDLAERVVKGEMEGRIAEAMAKGNREVAENMRTASETFQGAGGGETINRDDAKKMFEKAYNEVLTRDPEGAQHMKEMFETAERGEFVRPTPEMMERMHEEMGEYLRENPEMREYAHVEWDRMMEHGMEGGMERGADVEHYREMMERGMPEGMQHEFERGTDTAREFEHYREIAERYFEAPEHYFERDNSAILDNRAELFINNSLPPPEPPPSGGSGEGPHTFVQDMPGSDSLWDGNDADNVGDHLHPDGTAPHNGP